MEVLSHWPAKLKALFRSLCSIYLLLWAFAIFFGDHMIFVPPKRQYSAQDEYIRLISYEDSEFQLATFYLPAGTGMPTLLWSHGNAENLSMTDFLHFFHQKGFGIYAYDYPGYGLSGGKPSEENCYAAVKAAYSDLQSRHNVDKQNIILVGQSVGSGPTTYLAEREIIRGVILISPFTSIYRVAFGLPIFTGDRFPNINRIKNISAPLMVIHGSQDEIIPVSHGKSLIQNHKGKSRIEIINERGHNNIIGSTISEIEAFVALFTEFNQSL